MSRFLEHLVTRSLEAPGLLQPRLTSRFEPPSITPSASRFGPSSLDADGERVPPVASAPEQPEHESRREDSVRQVRAINTPRAEGHDNSFVPESATGADTQPRAEPLRESGQSQQFREEPHTVGQVEQRTEIHHQDDLASPDVLTAEPDRAASFLHTVRPPDGFERQQTSQAAFQTEERLFEPVPTLHIRPTTRGMQPDGYDFRRDDQRSIREAWPHSRRMPGEVAWQVGNNDHSEPPSVQISIGRVEVRAVSPPMPQPAQPRAEPKLSLEQYLKQRDGGEP